MEKINSLDINLSYDDVIKIGKKKFAKLKIKSLLR
jgi:tyrosyl-tRNA synthetase